MPVGDKTSKAVAGNDLEYKQAIQSLIQNIQTMSSNVNTLRTMAEIFGTNRETFGLFQEMQRKQHSTNQLAQKIGEQLLNLATHFHTASEQEQNLRTQRLEKMRNNFSDTLNSFQIIQKIIAEKEKASIEAAKSKFVANNLNTTNNNNLQQESNKVYADDFPILEDDASADNAEEQAQLNLSLEEIEQREKAILRLEQDIVAVNDIFRDLATMISEQGEMIDSIEANVETANQRIVNANKQLEQAYVKKRMSRKKVIIVTSVLLAVALAMILIIYFSVRK